MKIIKPITAFHLKLIAIITMFLDHLSEVILGKLANAEIAAEDAVWKTVILNWAKDNSGFILNLFDWFWWIGRCSFPLFCFLLVQGFLHTKNIKKYAGRLFIFALLSEVPYDMAFNYSLLEFNNNNIMITLLLGLLLIWGISVLEKFFQEKREAGRNRILCRTGQIGLTVILVFLAAILAAEVLSSDYHMVGVLAIVILYLGRNKPVLAQILCVLSMAAVLAAPVQLIALATVIPVYFYGGEAGKRMKYFAYFFYPLHLLLLVLFNQIMGIG